MSLIAYDGFLPALGLTESDVSNVLTAVGHSDAKLREARTALADFDEQLGRAAAVFVLGSLARREASDCSDVDLGFIYFDDLLSEQEAMASWNDIVGRLDGLGFDVAQKTFDAPQPLAGLLRNIGGRDERNIMLTYRALLLTEAAWIVGSSCAEEVRTAIFSKYTEGTKSRGRNLTSLSNDLHRYYRTLCVDYRFKVEEEGKPWAIRNIKLRHSRKLWHLGNIAVQCAVLDVEEDERDAHLAARLLDPPLLKVASALDAVGQLASARELFCAYDIFLGEMAKPEVRDQLEALAHTDLASSAVFHRLRANAQRLQDGASQILRTLQQRDDYRAHIERYVIL